MLLYYFHCMFSGQRLDEFMPRNWTPAQGFWHRHVIPNLLLRETDCWALLVLFCGSSRKGRGFLVAFFVDDVAALFVY